VRFSLKGMRSFAMGVLRYTPDEFGKLRIGHMLEAMAGYQEAKSAEQREQTEILRIAVAILWNVQVKQEDRLSPQELWRLPWDKPLVSETILPEEEVTRVITAQKVFLEKMFGKN
jgi:hypothetical protein